MKVLLLGAQGQLGRALAEAAPRGVDLIEFDRHTLDVTDGAAVRREIAKHRPAWVVNAAAMTAVDRAESDPPWTVNAEAPETIGEAAAAIGAAVVQISTDYVFDGQARRPYLESDQPNPINVYGRTKLEGERRLLATGATSLIARTQWLFGRSARCFPRTMLSRALRGERTTVVDDQVGRPTYASDLASAVWHAMTMRVTGVLHVANDGEASWHDVARFVFQYAGVPHLLTPCTSADYPSVARRPAYSVLDTSRAATLIGPLRHWQSALAEYLETLPPS